MVNAGRLKNGRSYDLVGSTPTAPTILVCLQQNNKIFFGLKTKSTLFFKLPPNLLGGTSVLFLFYGYSYARIYSTRCSVCT